MTDQVFASCARARPLEAVNLHLFGQVWEGSDQPLHQHEVPAIKGRAGIGGVVERGLKEKEVILR